MHIFNGLNWGMTWGMGLSWIFLIGMLIFIIWAVIKIYNSNKNLSSDGGTEALGILKERFARGDINTKEYNEKRPVLPG